MIPQDDLDLIVDRFGLASHRLDGVEASYIESAYLAGRYANFYGPNVREHIGDADIERFLDFYEQVVPRYELPFHDLYRKRTASLLRAFCNWLVQFTAGSDYDKPVQATLSQEWRDMVIPHAELDALFCYLDKPEHILPKLVLEFLLGTRCEISDLQMVKLEDIDLREGKVLIRRNHARYHYVALGPGLRLTILKYLTNHHPITNPAALLICDENGDEPPDTRLAGMVKTAFAEAGCGIRTGAVLNQIMTTHNDACLRLGSDDPSLVSQLGERIDPGVEVVPPHSRMRDLVSLNRFAYHKPSWL